MIYAYIRTNSSDDKYYVQDGNGQGKAIEEYCKKHDIEIDEYVYEDCGIMLPVNLRRLGRLFNRMAPGDKLICTDNSRISRLESELKATKKRCKKNEFDLIVLTDHRD